MTLTRIILLLFVGVLFAQALFYYPSLPETISTHFDAAGRPNALAEKNVFFVFEAVLLFILVTEALLLPWLIARLPDSKLNVPNRDFWTSEGRRAELNARISRHFESLGVVMLAFFVAVNQLLFRSNVERENLPAGITWALAGVLLLSVLVWLVRLPRLFRTN